MRYYIADCHFYHKNILNSMDHRPFETVEEMNEAMIEAWNRKVRKNDEVVILGDFSWGTAEQTNDILKRLNGKLYLIKGNHDHFLEKKDFDKSRFEWIRDYAELHDEKRKVVLSHYPIAFYNGQYRRDDEGNPRSFMLHGHIHNTKDQEYLDVLHDFLQEQYRPSLKDGKSYNVPANYIN